MKSLKQGFRCRTPWWRRITPSRRVSPVLTGSGQSAIRFFFFFVFIFFFFFFFGGGGGGGGGGVFKKIFMAWGPFVLFPRLPRRPERPGARSSSRSARGRVWPGLALRAGSRTVRRRSPANIGVATWRELHLKLIERLAPPSVVVTDEYEIVHLSERAARFLRSGWRAEQQPAERGRSATTRWTCARRCCARSTARPRSRRRRCRSTPTGPGGLHPCASPPARDLTPGFLLVTFELRAVDAAAHRSRRRPAEDAHERTPAAADRRAEVALAQRHRDRRHRDPQELEGEQRRAAGDERGAALRRPRSSRPAARSCSRSTRS